ncbi:hypothetical protein VTK26DRAFT_642 [Humicola hyalothermophila]
MPTGPDFILTPTPRSMSPCFPAQTHAPNRDRYSEGNVEVDAKSDSLSTEVVLPLAGGSLDAGRRGRRLTARGVRVVREVAQGGVLVRAEARPVATRVVIGIERRHAVGGGRRRHRQAAGTGSGGKLGRGANEISRGSNRRGLLHRRGCRLGGGCGEPRRLRRGRRLDGEGLRLHTAGSVHVLEDLALDLQIRTTDGEVVLRCQGSAANSVTQTRRWNSRNARPHGPGCRRE